MRDYVFIGWSESQDLAVKIKERIDPHGFVGVIGGDYVGNPVDVRGSGGTIYDTVNFQMSHCDQAILLFRKVAGNPVISSNLIYELGYLCSKHNYGKDAAKIHNFSIDITKKDIEIFPSDVHGIWNQMLTSADKTLDQLADEIVSQFLTNQMKIGRQEKFRLLNDYHMVEFEIMKHMETPNMSDYDLAKDILVYQQAAFCYQEQVDVRAKIVRLKGKMVEKECLSKELRWAVDYAEVTLDLFCATIPNDASLSIRMDRRSYRSFLKRYIAVWEQVREQFPVFAGMALADVVLTEEFNRLNEFEALLISQIQEHITYLMLVYLSSSSLSGEERLKCAQEGITYCDISIRNLMLLGKHKENEMYIKVLLSYAYKNLATFQRIMGDTASAAKNSAESGKLRGSIASYVSSTPFMRDSLKDYFMLEHLLQVVENIKDCDDEDQILDDLDEIETYLNQRAVKDSIRDLMVNILRSEYEKLKKQFCL